MRALFDSAAFSGRHAQPTRPLSVMAPSRSGKAEGVNESAPSALTSAAPAIPTRKQIAETISSPTRIKRVSERVDIPPIIAQVLKKE